MNANTDDVAEAIEREHRLLSPQVRTSRALAGELLDPDFVEVGASGRRWNRQEMLAELPEMPGGSEDGPEIEISAMSGTALAPGLVHLTYESAVQGHRAYRSSLWRKSDADSEWQMYYHQGTPLPSE